MIRILENIFNNHNNYFIQSAEYLNSFNDVTIYIKSYQSKKLMHGFII